MGPLGKMSQGVFHQEVLCQLCAGRDFYALKVDYLWKAFIWTAALFKGRVPVGELSSAHLRGSHRTPVFSDCGPCSPGFKDFPALTAERNGAR